MTKKDLEAKVAMLNSMTACTYTLGFRYGRSYLDRIPKDGHGMQNCILGKTKTELAEIIDAMIKALENDRAYRE